MALFGKESAEERAARERREEQEAASLSSLQAGGLPVHAQERLREEAERGGFFTSDLSVNEHLLARHAGFEPVGQVMGSAFYRIAYRGYYADLYQPTGELSPLSRAQLEVRSLALSRLKQEAALLGADGVIGVRLTLRAPDWGDRLVEVTAIGTAIRLADRAAPRGGEPFTSDLSGQEFWKLYDAGYLPKEIAFGVCSYYIHSDMQTAMVLNNFWGAGMANQEFGHFTAGFQTARSIAMRRFAGEVRSAGGDGAVGVRVDWDFEEIEYEVNETSYLDLVVHFTAVGTAIAARKGAASPGRPTLTIYNLKDRASFQLNTKE